MRKLAGLGGALMGAALVVGCARMEVAQFQPSAGQQTLIRDGVTPEPIPCVAQTGDTSISSGTTTNVRCRGLQPD
jgi:hypothetical protein